jgi:hypothetical protein
LQCFGAYFYAEAWRLNMKPYARYCLYALIIIEITLYGIWYLASPRGIRAIKQHQEKIFELQQQTEKNHRHIDILNQSLQDWHDYPLYHEQQARALQYVFPGDEVYIAPKSHQ